jgi:predicted ester cyclase
MTRDEITALFTRRDADWRNRNSRTLAADHAPDGIVVSPTGGVLEGRGEIERIYRLWFNAFPDLAMVQTDLAIDGDLAILLVDISGTHSGDFFGLAATGRRVQVTGAFVYRLKDGLIQHERRILDFTGVLIQVGVLKAKPAAVL